MEKDWLKSTLSLPDVRRAFTALSQDDLVGEIDCTLKYVIDDQTDQSFCEELFAVGMVYSWASVRLRSSLNVSQMFGGKEEKFYSQAAHIAELRNIQREAEREMRGLIRDRGFFHNTYLDGE